MTDSNTPPGWYPDGTTPDVVRYWDGITWTEHTQPAGTEVTAPHSSTLTIEEPPAKPGRRFPTKWWHWALIALAVIVFISIIVNGANGDADETSAPKPPTGLSQDRDEEPAVEEEPEVDLVEVPDLVGMTIAEANAALVPLGLKVPVQGGEDWIITYQVPVAGEELTLEDLTAQFTVTTEAPKPVYTVAQQNAIDKAQSYLDYSGFSRLGLIDQLEYEGFPTADATFGADNAGADWNAEAAEKAKSYMDYSSFSRDGLADQLAYEEFTPEQIAFALTAVGY